MLQLWPIYASLAFVLFIYGFRPVQRWRLKHIPGPKPAWLFGNLAEIVKLGKHEAFHRWGKAYGGVCKIFEGGIPSVVVTDVKLTRYYWILYSHDSISAIYFFFEKRKDPHPTTLTRHLGHD